eukprot:1186616-Prorocentrum_minimum.AAC.2
MLRSVSLLSRGIHIIIQQSACSRGARRTRRRKRASAGRRSGVIEITASAFRCSHVSTYFWARKPATRRDDGVRVAERDTHRVHWPPQTTPQPDY